LGLRSGRRGDTLFNDLISQGSVLAVVLMMYAYGVVFVVGEIYLRDKAGVFTPGVVRSGFGTLIVIAALPTAIWPAIYVGLWDGFVSGVVTFGGQMILAPLVAKLAGVTGALMGVHFYGAAIALGFGYWLSFTHLP